jgi:hypothetical protein
MQFGLSAGRCSTSRCDNKGRLEALGDCVLTNMIEAGLSEKEAMTISGHKTRSVFDRYHIVSERRMTQNAEKLEEHLKSKETIAASAAVQDGGASHARPNRKPLF